MLIKDWMTRDPITINEETSMIKAIHIMKKQRFRRLPVVSSQGRLVGMVTDRDLKEASPSKATTLDVHELYYLLAELRVKEIMTRNPISVQENDTVEHAAQVMLEHTISGLPVLDAHDKLVGILTQSDVFRAFMHITGILQGGVQFALRLEDRPGILKDVADSLRAKGGRMVSLQTTYPSPEENLRDVYIRVKNLSPEAVEEAKKELAARFQLLYVIQDDGGLPAA
jgi:acetoin utilization protein AcuB